MTLQEYFETYNITMKDFADAVGITPGHIYNFNTGNNPFGKKLAIKIVEYTGGKVDYTSLRQKKKKD
jgi:plasmid maintenance system antidote protein VapI